MEASAHGISRLLRKRRNVKENYACQTYLKFHSVGIRNVDYFPQSWLGDHHGLGVLRAWEGVTASQLDSGTQQTPISIAIPSSALTIRKDEMHMVENISGVPVSEFVLRDREQRNTAYSLPSLLTDR